jgi:YggT family protein
MIRLIINIYVFIVVADAIFSFFPQFQRESWVKTIKKLAEYSTKPIRKLLPPDLPFDFSPLIVVFLLNLVKLLW